MNLPGPDFVHTVMECAKLAFADRELYYGDPKFNDVPLAVLLSDEYVCSVGSTALSVPSRILSLRLWWSICLAIEICSESVLQWNCASSAERRAQEAY